MDAAALDDLATATDDEAYSARVRRRVQAGVFVAACLSLAGSAFITALHCGVPRARTSQSFYIVHLAAADGVLAVSDLLRPRPAPASAFRAMTPACRAQAFLHVYGELSSVLWTSLVAHSLLEELYSPPPRDGARARARRARALAVGHVAPLALTAVPLGLDMFDWGFPYCTISVTGSTRSWLVFW